MKQHIGYVKVQGGALVITEPDMEPVGSRAAAEALRGKPMGAIVRGVTIIIPTGGDGYFPVVMEFDEDGDPVRAVIQFQAE